MKTRFLFSSALAFLALSEPAYSQDTSPSPTIADAHLPPVIVTSQGEEENYLEVPARVDKVKKEDLARDRVRFVGESLNRIPGVITREMNPLIPAIGIRTPSNTNTPYWLATHDSIPTMPSVYYTHESPTRMSFVSGAGDFEVLKGASSMLYGSDAISAVVNLRSPEPAPDSAYSVGILGGERGFQQYKFKLNPGFSGRDGWVFFGNYTADGGWRRDQQGKRAEAIIRNVRKLESGDTLTTTLIGNGRGTTEAGYITQSQWDADAADPGKTGAGTGLEFYRRHTYARLTSEWKHPAGGLDQLTVTPYLRFDDYHLLEYFSADNNYPMSDNRSQSIGVRTTYKLGGEQSEIIVGLDAEITDFTRRKEQTLATLGAVGSSPTTTTQVPQGVHYDYKVQYSTISPFAKYSWFISKPWRWDMGLRANWSKYNYKNGARDGECVATYNTDGQCGKFLRPGDRQDDFDNISPKTGVNFVIDSNQSAYANAGYGFRIPGATNLYEILVTDGAPHLKPEKSLTYELGYKFDTAFWGADLSVYHMEITDRIVRTQGGATATGATSVNAGKSQHEGLEMAARMGPVHDLTFTVAGTFSYSKYVDFKTYAGGWKDYSDRWEPQAPSQIFNIRLGYQPHDWKELWTELEWQKSSGYWLDDANSAWEAGKDLFHFRAEYSFGNFLANLKMMNVTDSKYAADAKFSTTTGRTYRPGMPRTAYAGLEYRF